MRWASVGIRAGVTAVLGGTPSWSRDVIASAATASSVSRARVGCDISIVNAQTFPAAWQAPSLASR